MKKILTLLLALMAILPASANSYLIFGVNDTLRIRPSSIGNVQGVMVRAHFEGRLDQWNMTLKHPLGMTVSSYPKRNDMLYIPYLNYLGIPSTCSAQLFYNEIADTTSYFMSFINENGYWDPNNDGIFETYGKVKWEAGDYDQMFEIFFNFYANLPDTASISIDGTLSATMDLRGGTIPFEEHYSKRIHYYVGYMIGDITGDENINIEDLSALTDYILSNESLDEYQLAAADVDGNGTIDVADKSALVELILTYSQNELENPTI